MHGVVLLPAARCVQLKTVALVWHVCVASTDLMFSVPLMCQVAKLAKANGASVDETKPFAELW